MSYLSAIELASLIGCRENSYACMKRWLTKHGWPFAVSISGFPKVARAYHDARMAGTQAAPETQAELEPDFSMFGS
jgi:hypothetical protein